MLTGGRRAGGRWALTALRSLVLLVGLLVAASACGRTTTPAAEPSPNALPSASPPESPSGSAVSPSPSASPSGAPTAAPGPTKLGIGTEGLGDFAFGTPMNRVVFGLMDLLGDAVDDVRMHGDMPMGWGAEVTTVRVVDFRGLRVVFQDWDGYFREDGVMHLVSWSADRPRASGVRLVTPEGISVGSGVAELQEAFGASLHLPDPDRPDCAEGPFHFAVEPEEPWGLIGTLSGPAADPGARVDRLAAGATREGWWPCWEP